MSERTLHKVIVTGSRYWASDEHIEIIVRELSKLPANTVIVHGAAKGVDTISAVVGELLGFEVRSYPADWKRFRKRAGPIRNQQMLDCERPDIVIGFHDDIDKSSGTKHMLKISKDAGIKTILHSV